MTTIAIIGAGQLGSRHLQALARLKSPAEIHVVDPSPESLRRATERFEEVRGSFRGNVAYAINASGLPDVIDIAIVATNSRERRAAIEYLAENFTVRNFILEKFLFCRTGDYAAVGNLLEAHGASVWVNCPRRMHPFYRDLKRRLSGRVHMTVTGNAWGLGCNGIHMLDLFAFLTGSLEIALSHDLLDEQIIASKRAGYYEFTGCVEGRSPAGMLSLVSHSADPSPIQVAINSAEVRCVIEEGPESRVWRSERAGGWAPRSETFTMPFQSQLTNLVVEDILKCGECELPRYAESAKLHQLFLEMLCRFMAKRRHGRLLDECLIT